MTVVVTPRTITAARFYDFAFFKYSLLSVFCLFILFVHLGASVIKCWQHCSSLIVTETKASDSRWASSSSPPPPQVPWIRRGKLASKKPFVFCFAAFLVEACSGWRKVPYVCQWIPVCVCVCVGLRVSVGKFSSRHFCSMKWQSAQGVCFCLEWNNGKRTFAEVWAKSRGCVGLLFGKYDFLLSGCCNNISSNCQHKHFFML